MSKATNNPGVVAVTDMQTAGAIVWWKLTGEVAEDVLANAWEFMKLDPKKLPESPSARMAMARAVKAMQERRLLARPLADQKGWALVQERITAEGGLTHETAITARLTEGDQLDLILPGGVAEGPREAELRGHFARYSGVLISSDISYWLARLVRDLKAVALRESGGVYFIPRDSVEAFRVMVGAIKSVSAHEVYEVPALKSEEAIAAIMAAVLAEADAEVASMESDIAEGALGARALKTRTDNCEALREKIQSYEALLGQSMDAMHTRIEGLEAKITSAIFAAGGDTQQQLAV